MPDIKVLAVFGVLLLISATFGILIYIWILMIYKKPLLWREVEIVSWASSSIITGPDGSYRMSGQAWQVYNDVVLKVSVGGQTQNRRYAAVRVCSSLILHPGQANLLVIEDIRFKPGQMNNVLSIVAVDQGSLLYSPLYLRESLSYFGTGCWLPTMIIAGLSVFVGILAQIFLNILSLVGIPAFFLLFSAGYMVISVWAKKRLYYKVEKILCANYPDHFII